MVNIEDLDKRLKVIESRNVRVDNNKAWETSWTRRLSVGVLTYIVVALYLRLVVHISPWINALVPVIGFLLSSLTVSLLKKRWMKQQAKK